MSNMDEMGRGGDMGQMKLMKCVLAEVKFITDRKT